MLLDVEIAKISALLGDKTRASILIALMEGKALTAGELALRANISPQTASNHLKKLLSSQLITHIKTPTRYRYYKISSPLVAAALESISLLTTHPKKPPRHEKLANDICFARSCYDHLAGELGVRVTRSFLTNGYLEETDETFIITTKGHLFFEAINISIPQSKSLRRPIAKPCLDWTEREYHLAGSLGHTILEYFLTHRFVICSKTKPRVLVLTFEGKCWLKDKLSIEV
jgi:DNA-binding transcriptional ArsR family regulator